MIMDENTKEILLYGLPIASTLSLAWIGYLTLKVKTKVESVAGEVAVVKTATDGLTAKLLTSTAEAAKSVGKDEERKEQEAREAERAKGSLAVKDSTATPGQIAAKEKNDVS